MLLIFKYNLAPDTFYAAYSEVCKLLGFYTEKLNKDIYEGRLFEFRSVIFLLLNSDFCKDWREATDLLQYFCDKGWAEKTIYKNTVGILFK